MQPQPGTADAALHSAAAVDALPRQVTDLLTERHIDTSQLADGIDPQAWLDIFTLLREHGTPAQLDALVDRYTAGFKAVEVEAIPQTLEALLNQGVEHVLFVIEFDGATLRDGGYLETPARVLTTHADMNVNGRGWLYLAGPRATATNITGGNVYDMVGRSKVLRHLPQ